MKVVVTWKVGKEVFDATVNAKNGQDAIKIVKADIHDKKAYDWKAEE